MNHNDCSMVSKTTVLKNFLIVKHVDKDRQHSSFQQTTTS